MIGEPDAGKPHVRFDEGVQETCDIAARLRPTLQRPAHLTARAVCARHQTTATGSDPRPHGGNPHLLFTATALFRQG